ncbi:Cof-type HAD-IIB family hydrolase [Cohnella suwonensis]|uniref:Cof-type HAD-IIB family hydrolase n=1 Tax=Cohnella suwonensis TaxID=696072 RepID=A0ABW0LY74_9BACL
MADVMGNYKLLALDLDGTLLNDRSEISETNLEWVRRAAEAGVTVCVSTGRGFPSALPIVEQLGLNTPMITVNGGEIWTKPHEIHRRTLLDWEKVAKLREIALRHDVWYWAYSTGGIHNKEQWVDDVPSLDWLKFGYYTEDVPVLQEILREIGEGEGLEISNSSPYNIEINPMGVSKATALMEVCSMLGYEMSEVASMGDSLNDIAAIRASGLGVAMGNAQEEVKLAANVVTGSNTENGVAEAIRQYVLRT